MERDIQRHWDLMHHSANSSGKLEAGMMVHSHVLLCCRSLADSDGRMEHCYVSHFALFQEVVTSLVYWEQMAILSFWTHVSVYWCYSCTDLLFYFFNGRKAFFHLHLVCMLCWRSINAEWCISTASKTIIFHSCRFSPQSFSFLLVSACARVWNIYEGARDGAPFKDLPLWLWIRAFSTCTE